MEKQLHLYSITQIESGEIVRNSLSPEKYELHAFLGSGTSCDAFSATRLRDGANVVLKELRNADRNTLYERLCTYQRIRNRCPNQIFAAFGLMEESEDGPFYFEQDQQGGATLDRIKTTSLLDEFKLLRSMLQGLEGLHSGIDDTDRYVLLDIKPNNIYEQTSPSGSRTCIATFFDIDSVISLSDVYKGKPLSRTFGWAPLELHESPRHIGPWSDTYACALVIFWRLLDPTTRNDTRMDIMNDPSAFPDPSAYICVDRDLLTGKVKQEINTFFRKALCWASSREELEQKRYRDAMEMQSDVEKIIGLITAARKPRVANMNISPIDPYYVSRSEEKEIAQIFETHKLCFITGLSGSGKSELARQYASKAQYKYTLYTKLPENAPSYSYDMVLEQIPLLNASTLSDKETADIRKSFLNSSSRDVLLIVDNMNTDEDLFLTDLFMNTGDACILITSQRDLNRNDKDAGTINLICDDHAEDFCIDVFQKHLRRNIQPYELEDVKEILRVVGYHTFIIACLGTQLSFDSFGNGIHLTMADFKDSIQCALDVGRIKIQKDREIYVGSPYIIMHKLLGAVLKLKLDPRQQEVLAVLCLSGNFMYPREALCQLLGDQKNDLHQRKINEALKNLIDRNIVQLDKATNNVSLHALMAEVLASSDQRLIEPTLLGRDSPNFLLYIQSRLVFILKDESWYNLLGCNVSNSYSPVSLYFSIIERLEELSYDVSWRGMDVSFPDYFNYPQQTSYKQRASATFRARDFAQMLRLFAFHNACEDKDVTTMFDVPLLFVQVSNKTTLRYILRNILSGEEIVIYDSSFSCGYFDAFSTHGELSRSPIYGGEAVICGCSIPGNRDISIEIPNTIDGCPVTMFAPFSFVGCNITNVSLPASLEFIGVCAFRECRKLRRIDIPENVQVIGDGAFSKSGLFLFSTQGNPLIYTTAFSQCFALTKMNSTSLFSDDDVVISVKDHDHVNAALIQLAVYTEDSASGSETFMDTVHWLCNVDSSSRSPKPSAPVFRAWIHGDHEGFSQLILNATKICCETDSLTKTKNELCIALCKFLSRMDYYFDQKPDNEVSDKEKVYTSYAKVHYAAALLIDDEVVCVQDDKATRILLQRYSSLEHLERAKDYAIHFPAPMRADLHYRLAQQYILLQREKDAAFAIQNSVDAYEETALYAYMREKSRALVHYANLLLKHDPGQSMTYYELARSFEFASQQSDTLSASFKTAIDDIAFWYDTLGKHALATDYKRSISKSQD